MADLCSLSDVKAWLATGTDAFPSRDDALLARLISSASAFIESWLSRPIGLDNWQEIRDCKGGEGLQRMVLWATPVVDILGLAILDGGIMTAIPRAPGFTQFPQIPATGQAVQPSFIGPGWASGYTFTSTEVHLWGWRFPRRSSVVIQYRAGYDPIPADIQQACVEMVGLKYKERTRIGVKTINIGGIETITYETLSFSMSGMASDMQALLWQYRAAAPLLPATRLPPPPVALELEDASTVIELEDQETPIIGELG